MFCEFVTEKVRNSLFSVGAVLCMKNDEKTFQYGRFREAVSGRKKGRKKRSEKIYHRELYVSKKPVLTGSYRQVAQRIWPQAIEFQLAGRSINNAYNASTTVVPNSMFVIEVQPINQDKCFVPGFHLSSVLSHPRKL